MGYVHVLFVAASVCLTLGQRPFFAGSRPIGYPEVEKPSTLASELGNRFGEATTTQRLPIEALGDRDLVDRLSKLPIDKQPFWLLNWQALEAHRQEPQTYPLNPNSFVDKPTSENNSSGFNNVNSVPSGNLGNRSGNTSTKKEDQTPAHVLTSQTVAPNTVKPQETNVKQSVHSASKDKTVSGKTVN